MTEQKLQRNNVLTNIEIVDLATNNKGIAKINGQVVFVYATLPGDIVNIELKKKRKGIFEARVLEYVKLSDKRIDAVCKHFPDCGGCKIQHLKYEEQLELKEKMVNNNLDRIAKIDIGERLPIMPSPDIFYYRNKLEFTFSTRRWLTSSEIDSGNEFKNRAALGFHAPGRFDRIIDIENCHLLDAINNEIRNKLREFALSNNYSFYDQIKQEGFLRNIIVRYTSLKELMIVIVFGDTDREKISSFMEFVSDSFPQASSLYYFINTKLNDSLNDLNPVFYSGKAQIREKIGHIEILLGPKSFYQTNSVQALNLYNVVKDFAQANKNDILYDLYAGVGSIGLFLAKDVKQVVGIESVSEAVDDANINKVHNKVDNANFYSGLVEDMLSSEFTSQNGKPNIIVTDPPRSGLHKKVVDALLLSDADKIIYVSCNPATQARDLELLKSAYECLKVQPVDMFPHTLHVENVALLHKIK